MVAECVGRDVDGQRIVQFLVVSNFRIYRRWESGELIQSQYPDALASCKYSMSGRLFSMTPFLSPSILMTWLSLLLTPLLSDLLLLILLLYLPV